MALPPPINSKVFSPAQHRLKSPANQPQAHLSTTKAAQQTGANNQRMLNVLVLNQFGLAKIRFQNPCEFFEADFKTWSQMPSCSIVFFFCSLAFMICGWEACLWYSFLLIISYLCFKNRGSIQFGYPRFFKSMHAGLVAANF